MAFNSGTNLTENFWVLLRIKVSMRKPSNVKELIKVIETEWNILPSELAQHFISCMESRIENVIESNDNDIGY